VPLLIEDIFVVRKKTWRKREVCFPWLLHSETCLMFVHGPFCLWNASRRRHFHSNAHNIANWNVDAGQVGREARWRDTGGRTASNFRRLPRGQGQAYCVHRCVCVSSNSISTSRLNFMNIEIPCHAPSTSFNSMAVMRTDVRSNKLQTFTMSAIWSVW
jgi:hypothetical protein